MPAAGAERLVLGVARARRSGRGPRSASRRGWRTTYHMTTLSPSLIVLPVELGVARRGAAEVGEGREHPQRLLDGARDERRVVEQQLRAARGPPCSARMPLQ